MLRIPTTASFAVIALVSLSSALVAESPVVDITDVLPKDYVRDGSVSYQEQIQQALDDAPEGSTIVFTPMAYAVDETGWTLKSGLTLSMRGAKFQLSEDCADDGAVFRCHDVSDVTFIGGNVLGRNDVWKDGVNIRGVHISGKSERIRIHEMQFRDLSSNGIGLFGTEEQPIRDVWVRDVVTKNCCKRYPDYLSGEKPEKGSEREDQGDVAFYYAEDFVVSGCRFEGSRSDGTHFYRSKRGQITDNRIYRAKMGGYFLETCESVIGRGNVMLENGSRGVTIERDSRNCIFADNVVRLSGREGLWAPDCVGLVVTGNVFDRNGRKPNGPEKKYIWNANITINEAHGDPTNAPTQNYLISDNMITTTESQIAAVRIDTSAPETENIIIRDNVLLGENRKLLIEGPAEAEVKRSDNTGAEIERRP
jgi:hypothetical protein